MGVRNDTAQFIQSVVQIVHSSPFTSVDAQPNGFALTVFSGWTAGWIIDRQSATSHRRHSCHSTQTHDRLVMMWWTNPSASTTGRFSLRQTVVMFQTAIIRMEMLIIAACTYKTQFFGGFIKNGLKQKQTKHQEKPTQSTYGWGREKFNYVDGAFSKSHELN